MKKVLLIDYPYPDGQARAQALRLAGFDLRVFNLVRSRIWPGPSPVKARIKPALGLLKPLRSAAAALDKSRLNAELTAMVAEFRPELVLIVKGDKLTDATLRRIRRICAPLLINWDADSILTPGRAEFVVPRLKLYDMFFSVDELELLPAELRAQMRRRNSNLHSLPLAANVVHYAPRPAVRPGNYTAFVGTVNPARRMLLERAAGCELEIWAPRSSAWGPWLEPGSALTQCHRGEGLYGEALLDVYAGAGVVLDIHFLFAAVANIPNVTLRIFEVPAAGGFVLTNWAPQLPGLFKIDEEIVCYADAAEFLEKLRYYRGNPRARAAIAARARARVLRDHTFAARFATMFGIADVKP